MYNKIYNYFTNKWNYYYIFFLQLKFIIILITMGVIIALKPGPFRAETNWQSIMVFTQSCWFVVRRVRKCCWCDAAQTVWLQRFNHRQFEPDSTQSQWSVKHLQINLSSSISKAPNYNDNPNYLHLHRNTAVTHTHTHTHTHWHTHTHRLTLTQTHTHTDTQTQTHRHTHTHTHTHTHFRSVSDYKLNHHRSNGDEHHQQKYS